MPITDRLPPTGPRPRAVCGRPARPIAGRQSGSILVQFFVLIAITILMLGVVDMGYLYYAKRDLQRIADLAAIEAAQHINAQRNNKPQCISAGQACSRRQA